jgi:hypothetical protein
MRNSDRKRDWGFIFIGLLAVTLIGLVIAYKYSGDFSSLATLGTNRQMTPRQYASGPSGHAVAEFTSLIWGGSLPFARG